jgi:short-subunit dehydrogenase
VNSRSDELFPQRYGSWALILGGSDGVGAGFALQLAQRGMNCFLVARRPGALADLAAQIRAAHQVEVRTLSLDLTNADALPQLDQATAGLDVGLVVFNAGADDSGVHFLDAPIAQWRAILARNIDFLTEGLHFFGQRMRAKKRGGLVVVGSGAAFGGGARGAIYTATKGFALNLTESLWAELKPHGVDVIALLFFVGDTPTLRRALARVGIPIESAGAADATALARGTLEALPAGPVFLWDEKAPDDPLTGTDARRKRVESVSTTLDWFYSPKAKS